MIDAGRKTNSSAVCRNKAVHSSCKRLSTAIAAFAVLLGVGRVTARELPSNGQDAGPAIPRASSAGSGTPLSLVATE